MDDFEVQIIDLELPSSLSGASVFDGKTHYIFLNTAVSEELRRIALSIELQRTDTK